MITFHCDRCDRTIEVSGEMAGTKMECPDCGDMNIVPEGSEASSRRARVGAAAPAASGFAAGSSASSSGSATATRPTGSSAGKSHRDEALERAGLPPASGPEKTVITLHPAMFRAIPGLFLLLVLFVLGGLIGGAVFAFRGAGHDSVYMWLCFAVAAIGAVWLLVWWVKCHHVTLKITNKRTIRDLGLLSKSTSEVSHDSIRNFQVRQTFVGRLLNVGSIGISSSGQDEIEITVDHVARPMELRRIIDTYRHE